MKFDNLIGTVHTIHDVQVISDTFKKKEIILETDGGNGYKNYLPIEFTGDFIMKIPANLEEGDEVCVNGVANGRLYTDKHQKQRSFLSLKAFSIEIRNKAEQPQDGVTGGKTLDQALDLVNENIDDLPF